MDLSESLESNFGKLSSHFESSDSETFAMEIGFKVMKIVLASFEQDKDMLSSLESYNQDILYKFSMCLSYERLALTLALLSDEFSAFCWKRYDQRVAIKMGDDFQLYCESFLDLYFPKVFKFNAGKNGVSKYYRFDDEEIDFDFWENELSLLNEVIEVKKHLKIDLKEWSLHQNRFTDHIDAIDFQDETEIEDFESFDFEEYEEKAYEREDVSYGAQRTQTES